MTKMLVVDIETGPLPDEIVRKRAAPFKAPLRPGVFDPKDVKIPSNWKDPEKINAKIQDARQRHEKATAEHAQLLEVSHAKWWREAVEKAALDPRTGQVLAIGFYSTAKDKTIIDHVAANDREEAGLLERFWQQCKACKQVGVTIVGHNFFGFDLPFIYQRSRLMGVDVPEEFLGRRYFDDRVFMCTMQRWFCGQGHIGLDELASLLGVEGKAGGELELSDGEIVELSGANFHRFYNDSEESRLHAIDYLRADLTSTAKVAERLGIE